MYRRATAVGLVSVVVAVASVTMTVTAATGGQSPKANAQAHAQAKAKAAKAWTLPHTPWGDPDLQGLWSNATMTPLERPGDLGEKAVLSDEEFAQRQEQVEEARNTDRPPKAGDPGTYNEIWWERGKLLKRTSIISDPPDGQVPPLTSEAQKRVDARAAARRGRGPSDSWEDRNLHERCILYHGVPPLPTGYNNNYQLVQTPDHVAILSEMIHEVRLIPLRPRPHVGPAIRQWMGDSRGGWEGNTLIVDTTNFNGAAGGLWELNKPGLQGSGETLHIVERFTRVSENEIDYQFTVDDPKTFTRPWSGSLPMTKIEGPLFEYACHEGNYAMTSMLAGARAQEKAQKAEKR